MFRDEFVLRPHRDDIRRLHNVTKSPVFAASIKRIRIFVGDIDQNPFAKALHRVDAVYRKTVMQLRVQLRKNLWVQDGNVGSMREAFRLLPNLICVAATSNEYPFAGLNLRSEVS